MPAAAVVFRYFVRYGVAVLTVGVAVLLRVLLTDLTGRESPFLLCLIAVAFSAWWGGVGPAVVAGALGMVETAADASRHSLRAGPVDEVLAVSLFAIVACAVTLIANARRLSERARETALVNEREAREQLQAALESLAASEERYRLVSTVTNDALWDYDVRRGRIERAADGMQRVFGYKPGQVPTHVGWWLDRIHADDRDRVMRSFEVALASDAALWTEQYRFRAADGSYATVHDRAHILREGAGHPARMIGSLLDITPLTEAQRALRQGQGFLRRLIRAVPALIVVLDPAGRITLFNRAAEGFTGCHRRAALGRTLPDLLLPPEEAARYARHVADPLSPTVREPLTTAIRTREGRRRVVEWRFAPVRADGAELPYLMVTGVEVTEGVGVVEGGEVIAGEVVR